MKSIEERAKERYNDPQEPYSFESDREQQWYKCGECDGYIAGANDQRKIDIEMAASWWESRCDNLGISKYQIELFKKAMKEGE